MVTTDPTSIEPALLWNGLIGVRLARSGAGLDADGKPLGFFQIDEYESSGEEKILQLPSPALVTLAVGNELFTPDKKSEHDFLKSGGTLLDPRQGSGYRQTLDMKTGLLTSEWTQETPSAGKVSFKCESIVHPTKRIFAQRWTLIPEKSSPISIKALDYGGPEDPQEPVGKDQAAGVLITASPKRVVVIHSKLSGAEPGGTGEGGGYRIQEATAAAGKAVIFDRVLSFGDRSKSPLPKFAESNVEVLKAAMPPTFSFDEVLQQSKQVWAKRWETDIEIDGPVEDQQAVRSFLFYLRSAIATNGGMAISPFGLSDAQYSGHVFWDADIWVFPALALIDPEEALAIPKYRLARAKAAISDFQEWVTAGRPTAQQKLGAFQTTRPVLGLKYPWESSVSGRETTPTTMRFEDHITGSVFWGLTQAVHLGLIAHQDVDGPAAWASTYIYSRAEPGPKGLEIKGTVSPDENHVGDNDLYTNLLGQWLVDGRRWVGPGSPGLPQFFLPKDKQSFLSYDGDAFKGYKQAAAILSIYPLQFPEAEQEGKTMMDRFSPGVIKNGPAMSDAIDALIWARLGETSKGYESWRASWQPFTTHPLMLFSEKRTKPATYFTTGAAGSLQAVLYGMLGFRIDLKPQTGSAWSKELPGDFYLSIKPNLPPQWKSVKFKNFALLGFHYTLSAAPGRTSVTQGN